VPGPTSDADFRLPAPLCQPAFPVVRIQYQQSLAPAALEHIIVDSTASLEIDVASGSGPVAAATSDVPQLFGEDFDLPTWIDQHEPDRHSSTSSGDDSVFDPATTPSTGYAILPAPVRPVLTLSNLVTIARSAFGPGQTQLLVPSIMSGFATALTPAEVTDRLQLLWLMRREVATQVRDIILLGHVHQEPPGAVLLKLLKLVEQYTSDTQ